VITVNLEASIEEGWAKMRAALADGIKLAVQNAVREGAQEARQVHRYKDRSGNLTRSIRGTLVSYDRDGAVGEIAADAKYASFVEEGTRPHVINARPGKTLRWESEDGSVHFARSVNHPGTRSQPFMGPAYLRAERVLEAGINAAIASAEAELTS
jgi:hypothetical protein